MTPATPLVALETLERELASVCGDAPHAGATVLPRLAAILELLPFASGSAAAGDAAERADGARRLEAMRERCDALQDILRTELRRVGDELAQVRVGTEANHRYSRTRHAESPAALDRLG